MAPAVSPKVYYQLWVTMICQRRFINCKKMYPRVMGPMDDGVGCAWEVVRSYMEALYIELSFPMSLKVL